MFWSEEQIRLMSSSFFLQRSLCLKSDALCGLSWRKSLNPAGTARHRQRESDVGATKCVHLQCVMPVVCCAQIQHLRRNEILTRRSSAARRLSGYKERRLLCAASHFSIKGSYSHCRGFEEALQENVQWCLYNCRTSRRNIGYVA